jgi:hypothetical protein
VRSERHEVVLLHPSPHDLDGDGATTVERGGDDCDDTNAAVHPSAVEVCNAVDDDCDGATDEHGSVGELGWYVDADGDGFGSAHVEQTACAVPEGFVGNRLDCDDSNATIYPGTTGCLVQCDVPKPPVELNIDICVLSTRPFDDWDPHDGAQVDDHAGVVVDPADLDVLPSYVHPGFGYDSCTFPYSYVFIQGDDGHVYEVRANRLLPDTASFDLGDFAAIGIVDALQTWESSEDSWVLVDDIGLVAAASSGFLAIWLLNPYGDLLDVRDAACGAAAGEWDIKHEFLVNGTVVLTSSTRTVPTWYGDVAFTAIAAWTGGGNYPGQWFFFAARRR